MTLLPASRFGPLLRHYATKHPDQLDLIVIGGGSGGLACAKTAADLGAKVALVDGVDPSPMGSTWGLGGTCANVGCIPKKLMHQAALVGHEVDNARQYGWQEVAKKGTHNWNELVKVVNERIKANNWIYRVQLNQKKIKYINGLARFQPDGSVKVVDLTPKKNEKFLHGNHVVIATGQRPSYPLIKGAAYGITSDDIFTWPRSPGKTLVVGGGYVALETAGLLNGLGLETHLLIRSKPLKAFDQDCVKMVMANLMEKGVKVMNGMAVDMVKRIDGGKSEADGKKLVFFTDPAEQPARYDTVIWAIGREPRLDAMNLAEVGVEIGRDDRIRVDEADETSKFRVFAIGDIAQRRPELTPSAILSGQLLARRLFGGQTTLMNYRMVPTTVFTPLEFSAVGLSEEEAVHRCGPAGIEVYHSHFTPFEYVVTQDPSSEQCYAKIICERPTNRVMGMHFVGPNAAEVMQGFAVAVGKGITYEDIVSTVAIHPCSAEEFIKMHVTKRSGENPRGQGCCG